MNKRIRHLIMLVFLISCALQVQAQIALPEQVCVGTVQHYWVVGSPGSTYTWRVNGEIQSATSDNIDITWNELGTFTLEVQEHQLTCDGDVQTGLVTVTDQIIPEFSVMDHYCAGSIISALPTVSNNGIAGSWNPAIDNNRSTIYTFTPNAGQCAATTTLTITIDDQITPIFTQVGPYCSGFAIPQLPTTSNNGITGTWSPAIDNTRTTEYTFTPDANQCAATTTLIINITDQITPAFAQIGSYCTGATIPPLPTTSTNGITGTWSPAIDNTQTTEYTFTPDANQCAVPTTLTITLTDEVTPTFIQVGPYCSGFAIPPLPTTSTNGITGAWSPAIDNTQATEYTFTPDANQCAVSTTLTITITDEITPTFAQVGPYCSGFAIPQLPTTSNNGITGTWSPAIDNTQTTEYTFTPDANQCAVPATLTITISDGIIPTFEQVGPYCAGSVIPALPTSSNNGIAGTWSPAINNSQTTEYTFIPIPGQCATPTTLTISIVDQITPTFAEVGPFCSGYAIPALPTTSTNGITGTWSPAIDNTQTTEYTFTPDANQCAVPTTLTIAINDQVAPAFAQVGPYCTGFAIPALPTTSTNGITGIWRPSIDNTQTTEYTFTPNADQCAVSTTLTITVSDEITPTFDLVGPFCAGSTIPALPSTSTNGIAGTWSPAIDNTQTTEYTFTPNADQCAVPSTLTITISDQVIPTFDQVGPFCAGANIPALPTTSTNNITGIWLPEINNSQTTEYTFTPDAGQCSSVITMTITINESVRPMFVEVGPYCTGDDIPALPDLSDNGIHGTWSPAINNLQTTTYTFTPDEGECTLSTDLTIVVNQPSVPIFTQAGPYCAGADIPALPTVSTNGVEGTWSPDIDNMQTTTYTFTPNDGQCALVTSMTININEEITPEFTQVGPYCTGSAVPALPAISNNGIRGTWFPPIDNTQTTTYTFTPTDGQCGVPVSLTVEMADEIMPVFDQMGPYCMGTELPALPTVSKNGMSGSWSPDINNQQTTRYTFTPDPGQCGVPITMDINISDQVTPSFDPVGPFCYGSAIPALPAVSNNGISGTWSPDIDNTKTTTYTFTPDAGSCGTTTSLTIVINDEILPAFAAVGPYCAGTYMDNLPAVSTNGIRGTWSPAINNRETTTYTFTPTAGQCASITSLTITINDPETPTFYLNGSYCAGADIPPLPTISNNGIRGTWSPEIDNTRTTTYTFTPAAGQCSTEATFTIDINEQITPTFDLVGPYAFESVIPSLPTLSNNGIVGSWSPAINNQQTTIYTFTPSNGQCAVTASLTIEITGLTIPIFDPVGPYCVGSVIEALPTVSNNGISGTWSPEINNQQTTTYTFTPDTGQAAGIVNLTIVINNETLPTFATIGPYCAGATITDLPTTSTNGIYGSWSPSINNLETTTYTFTPDEGQCASPATMIIEIRNQENPEFSPVASYCSGSVIPALPLVSNNGITGTWSPAINNTQTTVYSFTPTDGQCANEATISIVIDPAITPAFDPEGPFCRESAIAALPTTSTNGITGTWSPEIDNTQTTTYTFTPADGQCAVPVEMTIEVVDEILPTFDPMGPYCPGATIADLPTVSNNGIHGRWRPAINNRQTTTYTFTPEQGECGIETTMTIVIEMNATPTFDPVGPYCAGSVIADLPTVSNNGITGTWKPAINNRQTTIYTFAPDAGQCGASTTMTIVITDPTTPTFDPVGPFCPGSVIADLPTVSNNGITGTWSPVINNQQSTNYTFTPDPGQCATSTTLRITIDQRTIPTFDQVTSYCNGSSIPALRTVSNNGIRGTWRPAINNTQTTTYTFTPDAGQCGETTTMTIQITDEVDPIFDPVGPYPRGAAIAALHTVSNNGISGTWRPAIDNTQTATYTFTPDAGQCSRPFRMTIVITDETIPVFDPVGPYCQGSVITALPAVSNNGIRGSWSPVINNQETTTYTFTPEAGQSAVTTTMTIGITKEIIPTFDPVRPYCPGSAVAALPVISNNGIKGSWSPAINEKVTTLYTFTPDAGQCALTATLTIEIGTDIIPDFDLVGPFCPGSDIEALPKVSKNGVAGIWSPVMNNMVTTDYIFTPYDGQCATSTTLTCEIGSEVTPLFSQAGPFCAGSAIEALPTTSLNGVPGTWSPALDNTKTTTYTFTPDPGRCALPTVMTITILEKTIPAFDPVESYCVGANIPALPATSVNGIKGTWSPAIDNTKTTTYTFTPEPDQCAVAANLTITINNQIAPTFTALGSSCQGADIPPLPSVSDNGIKGTWSPAINNQQTTTYTFTPDPGQCANNTTMVVAIDQKIKPVFAPVASYCKGSVIPALPTVSTNGIKGTWSPAINNQVTTTYTFTPEIGQCADSTEITIEIQEKTIPLFDQPNVYCAGSSIADLPSVSTNNIRGKWAPAIDKTKTTTYIFTPDAGQCASSTTLTIFINSGLPMPVSRVIQPDCNTPTGTIEIVSPLGTQYQYSLDGANYQTGAVFTGLIPASSHTLQVKDVLTGCESKMARVTINSLPQHPAMPVAIIALNPKCNGGGVIEVTNPTGSDYEYSLDGGTYQGETFFDNIAWGNHQVRVRNKVTGCESAATNINIPAVEQDMDFDGIPDSRDQDIDGDGILNSLEGDLTADLDGDGLMNYLDIDSDGDGIVDNLEAQSAEDYILPAYSDEDGDGLDDAYDKDQDGSEIIPVDTDHDGMPDFLDPDSDNDLVPDFIEGHDENANGKPDHFAINKDQDKDGLDDGYDIIANECGQMRNALGSNATTQDFDGDGLPDYRDENDDDDEYLTQFEDLNADGDFSNDDIDFDGFPEYLDYGRDCDLFIPDAFSPNGDNVHDLYMIYCINHYPNATIYIFDQLGNKIYEKKHYGNLEIWKTPAAAWWDGRPTRGPGYSRNDLVPPGTYYYALDLGNGEVKKSYVFVSY